jgi:predicted TIM-barrel fold metal-dependent hydrolase
MLYFEMTQEQLDKIMDACKPTPVMYLSGGQPMCRTPQENANSAWEKLGKEMGFDGMTVKPSGKGIRFFTADPK